MPNTLAHLGVQTFATRVIVGDADVKWIFLGCVVPDLPWIGRRMLAVLGEGNFLYDISLYATLQASFLSCLLISACLAAFSDKSARVFLILASASLFHLLLDALQIKWGGGALIFAPVSWTLLSFDLYWPEELPSTLMTVFGASYVLWAFLKIPPAPFDLRLPHVPALLAAAACGSAYLLLPIALMGVAERTDAFVVNTVRDVDNRTGREASFDRVVLMPGENGDILSVFRGIPLKVTGVDANERALVSTKGRFVDRDTYEITEVHYHFGRSRDIASYIGLLCVVGIWLRDIGRVILNRR